MTSFSNQQSKISFVAEDRKLKRYETPHIVANVAIYYILICTYFAFLVGSDVGFFQYCSKVIIALLILLEGCDSQCRQQFFYTKPSNIALHKRLSPGMIISVRFSLRLPLFALGMYHTLSTHPGRRKDVVLDYGKY